MPAERSQRNCHPKRYVPHRYINLVTSLHFYLIPRWASIRFETPLKAAIPVSDPISDPRSKLERGLGSLKCGGCPYRRGSTPCGDIDTAGMSTKMNGVEQDAKVDVSWRYCMMIQLMNCLDSGP